MEYIVGVTAGALVLALAHPTRRSLLYQMFSPNPYVPVETAKNIKLEEDTSLLHLAAPSAPPEMSDDDDGDSGDISPRQGGYYAEESQNLLSLLYSIAEDQSRKGKHAN